MKKRIILLMGLITMATTHIYSMEAEQTILNKEQQKDFRTVLAGYRGMCVLQQYLNCTGQSDAKAESRLRQAQKNLLNGYEELYGNDPYVAHKLKRLEKFNNKEVPALFEQLKKVKTEAHDL